MSTIKPYQQVGSITPSVRRRRPTTKAITILTSSPWPNLVGSPCVWKVVGDRVEIDTISKFHPRHRAVAGAGTFLIGRAGFSPPFLLLILPLPSCLLSLPSFPLPLPFLFPSLRSRLLLPFLSSPLLPSLISSPTLLPFALEVRPWNPARESGERCKQRFQWFLRESTHQSSTMLSVYNMQLRNIGRAKCIVCPTNPRGGIGQLP